MSGSIRHSYRSKSAGGALVSDLAPFLPIELKRNGVSLQVEALVDSGSDLSILPFSMGKLFGVDWDSLNVPGSVKGSAGHVAGKIMVLSGHVKPFAPVDLLFLWVQTDGFPLIFGQANFFLEFDVCFFRSQAQFQVQPRTP